MARDPNYIEPVWREGLREVAQVMAVSMFLSLLLAGTVLACTKRHPSEVEQEQPQPPAWPSY